MKKDNRIFSGSISVRIGTKRIKIELSPVEIHGGADGFYRVRINRRWHDTPEGKPLFLDRAALEVLIGSFAMGDAVELLPKEAPDLPRNTRVSAKFWYKNMPYSEGVFTATPPFRGFDGRFYVGVMTYAAGFIFVPVEDTTMRSRNATD